MSEGKGNRHHSHLLTWTDMSSVKLITVDGHVTCKEHLGTQADAENSNRGKKAYPANIYNLQCHLAKQSWQSNRHTPTSGRPGARAGPGEGPQGWDFSPDGNGASPYRTPAGDANPPGRESGATSRARRDYLPLRSESSVQWARWQTSSTLKSKEKKQHLWNSRMETSVRSLHRRTREHVRAQRKKFWGHRQQPFPQVWEWVWASSFSSRRNSEVVQPRGWKARLPRTWTRITESLHCTAEINTTLEINYTSIKKKNFFEDNLPTSK